MIRPPGTPFVVLAMVAASFSIACGDDTAALLDSGPTDSPDARVDPLDAGDPGDASAEDAGGGEDAATPREIRHLASTTVYAPNGELTVDRPDSAEGDTLLLFLSRTDDLLPLALEDWTLAASCLKSDNGQAECLTDADCTDWDGDYCTSFGAGGLGRDLATAVFHRTVEDDEPSAYALTLRGTHPSWAILSAVRDADESDPVRDWAGTSNDRSTNSIFPSAMGEAGDLLLVSMAFDDTTAEADFLAPEGMSSFAWIAGTDEAGYVFGAPVTASGPTGSRETQGPGGPDAKDLLLTLVIAPAE